MTRSATPGEPETEAGRRLLVELSENPLDGARYAHGVVALRLPAVEAEARAAVIEQSRNAGSVCVSCGRYVALTDPRAESSAEMERLTVDDVVEWLYRSDGRLEDIFGLWVQGKRDGRWVAEKLLTEGHLAALGDSR